MFPSLFSPLQIGPIQIKNRIQITPHELQYMEGGLASDTLLNYFVERAKGGVGLSELSQLMIKPAFGVYLADWKYDSAQRFPIQSTPDIIPGLKTLTEGVHKFESKIFMEVSAWTWLYGPVSSMPFESGIELRELDVSEIRQIEEDFSRAAKFAKEAGFDGIDLHGTHGAMIEHFYSPATNLRTDRYGGTMENRMRFLFEVVDTVRSTIGDFIALGMRVCADEKIDGGVTPDYAAKMASLFDGKIDFVNVGTGAAGYFEAANQTAHQSEPLYTLPGYALSPAAEVKKVCKKTKVGAVGKILDPLMADDTIEKGFADYVGMTRALIADAELPRKAKSGQLEDIRPCIGTLQDCWGRSVAREWPMRCTVNPAVGREDERGIDKMTPAPRQKKVLIIGGGPAGLEAARVASERGHEVVIYEAGGVIGGQLNLAKLLPGRVDVGAISRWYEIQLQKRKNVRIELHKEVPEREDVVRYLAHDEKPDTVIIGPGSTARKDGMQMITHRPMPGWDSSNVMSIDEVFSSKTQIQGRRVLVADSTTYVVGAGAAEWLSRNGATEVVLVTPHPHIAPELSGYNQLIYVLDRLNDAHVRIIPLSWIRRIDQERTFVFPISKPTIEEELPVDYVVLHTGRNHRGTLLKKLFQPLVSEVYEIGDCVVAGDTLRGAIESGYQIGSTI